MSTHNMGFYGELTKTLFKLGLIFFLLGLRIFFQNNKVRGGKKIKIKITKKIFLFNLKHIWIGEKKIFGSEKKKNCMIIHCKNAEMTIKLSFLHFYSVKSYNFFFLLYTKL